MKTFKKLFIFLACFYIALALYSPFKSGVLQVGKDVAKVFSDADEVQVIALE